MNDLEVQMFQFYKEVYIPIYSDLVGFLGEKPIQVIVEIESAFSHVAAAKLNPNDYNLHITKAFHHIKRAALDCSKLLWVECKSELEKIIDDKDLRKYGLKTSEADFLVLYKKSVTLAKEARRKETNMDGSDIVEVIEAYQQAAHCMFDAINFVDLNVVARLKKSQELSAKSAWFGVILTGVIGGAIIGNLVLPDVYGALIGGTIGALIGALGKGVNHA